MARRSQHHMSLAAGITMWIALVSRAAGEGHDEWLSTIRVARTQELLTEQIPKEFYQIAHHISVEDTKSKLRANIAIFELDWNRLIDGHAPSGILPAPSTRVLAAYSAVLAEWAPTKAYLETNIDKVVNASAVEKHTMVEYIANRSAVLLDISTIATKAIVDAAAAAGTQDDVALSLASRQRMLVQKMCGEVLLVALGVSIDKNLAKLSYSREVFRDSNAGLIAGSEWTGVPMVTQVCTLQSMQKVRDDFEALNGLFDEIFVERYPVQAKEVALTKVDEVIAKSGMLSSSMAAATELFVHDDGSCDTLFSVTTDGWADLVNIIGLQRQEFEKMVATFMHIANNAAVAESTTTLSITISGARIRFMDIIGGSVARNIFPPPTQAIADDVINARTAFLKMEYLLVRATFEVGITMVACQLIALLSQEIGDYLRMASDKYVPLAEKYAPSVLPYNIFIAGRQRTLFEKMTKLACLTAYGIEVDSNFKELNASRDLYKASHRGLLAGSEEMGVAKTTQVCFVKQMYLVDDRAVFFDDLAVTVASGRPEKIADFPLTNRQAFAAINIAIDIYLGRSQACGNDQYGQNKWMQTIKSLGVLRASVWNVLFRFAISVYDDETQNQDIFQATLEDFEDKYVDMAYGNGRKAIIASFEQSILDLWYEFNGEWLASWHPEDSTTVLTVQGMIRVVDESMEKLNGLMQTYLDAADKDPAADIKTVRVNTVSSQVALAQKVAADAVRAKYGDISSDDFEATLAAFEANHVVMAEATIEERPDISALYAKITEAWVAYRRMATTLSKPGSLNRAEVMTSVNALEVLQELLSEAADLYAIPDVLMAKEETDVPYMTIAYCSIGGFLLCVVCLTIQISIRRFRRSGARNGLPAAGASV